VPPWTCSDLLQFTWLTTYSWSLNFLADDAYVHRQPRHWSYHRPGFEPLAIELFPSQQQNVEQSAAGSDVTTINIIISLQI